MKITARDIAEAIKAQDDTRPGIDQAYFQREDLTPADLQSFLFDGTMNLFSVAAELNKIITEGKTE